MADTLADLEMVSIEEMAERFHISKRTLQHLIKTQRLPGVKIGRQWRVRVADVRAFLAQQPQPTTSTPEPTPVPTTAEE